VTGQIQDLGWKSFKTWLDKREISWRISGLGWRVVMTLLLDNFETWLEKF
jgi:hypothetical protein